MRTITVTMPLPQPLLSLNARLHWAERARYTREQREAAGWAVYAAFGQVRPRLAGRVRLDVEMRPRKGQQRCDDTALWEAAKPWIDGLEDAGIIDNDQQIVVGSLVWSGTRSGEVVLTLTEVGA